MSDKCSIVPKYFESTTHFQHYPQNQVKHKFISKCVKQENLLVFNINMSVKKERYHCVKFLLNLPPTNTLNTCCKQWRRGRIDEAVEPLISVPDCQQWVEDIGAGKWSCRWQSKGRHCVWQLDTCNIPLPPPFSAHPPLQAVQHYKVIKCEHLFTRWLHGKIIDS